MKNSLKTPEPKPSSPTNGVRRRLATAALTLTAAFAASPAVKAEASTHKAHRQHEQHQRYQSLSSLRAQTIERLARQEPLAFFNGSLSAAATPNHTPSAQDPSFVGGVSKPLVIYRGNPKDQNGHNDLTNGDYVFGYINHSSDKPNVTLFPFDKQTMHLIPNTDGEPKVEDVVYPSDGSGGLDFNRPLAPIGLKGVPYINQAGNPELIAVASEAE
jgi:hypothetical protein